MSRIGNKPVAIPAGVTISLDGATVNVEGSKGKLSYTHRPEVSVAIDDGELKVSRGSEDGNSKAFHGLTRSIIHNMVVGVTEGYERKLEIVGVGYIATVQKGELQLRVGYANELKKKIPEGLEVVCPDQTHVTVKGCDKQQVTQFAAEVRSLRKPEPYKGKGIRYDGEQIKLKPGKAAAK